MSLTRLFFLVSIVMFMAGCDDGNAGEATGKNTAPASEETSSWCEDANKVAFGLKSPSNVKFLIPEAYLFDPYDIYYKPTKSKDSMDFISLLLNKVDGQPNCNEKEKKGEYSSAYTSVTIQPSSKDGFKISLDTAMADHTHDMGTEDKAFYIYRNNTEMGKMTSDLLIPILNSYKDTLFIRCSYGLALNENAVDERKNRVNCRVRSVLPDEMVVEYFIQPNELERFKEIDQSIKNTIRNFYTHNTTENL